MALAVRRFVLPVIALACFVVPHAGCSKSSLKCALQKAGAQMLKNSSDQSLEEMFEQANKACPRRMDAFTTLDEIVMVDQGRVEYRYIVNAAGKQLASRLDKDVMKQAFIDNMRGNPMAVAIAERDLAIDHIYNDEAGNYVLSYTIDRAVLAGGAQPTRTPQTNPFSAKPARSTIDSAFYADTSESTSTPSTSGSSPNTPGLRTNPFVQSSR